MKGVEVDEARLIRLARFRASHHYRCEGLSEEENHRVFGGQTVSHDHDWRLEVHVAGPIDPVTGWVADLPKLDEAIAALTAGWDGGDLNVLVSDVADGKMTPSTENLARWIFRELSGRMPDTVRVTEVRVFESPELGGAYPV